jgi:hypothetical protein
MSPAERCAGGSCEPPWARRGPDTQRTLNHARSPAAARFRPVRRGRDRLACSWTTSATTTRSATSLCPAAPRSKPRRRCCARCATDSARMTRPLPAGSIFSLSTRPVRCPRKSRASCRDVSGSDLPPLEVDQQAAAGGLADVAFVFGDAWSDEVAAMASKPGRSPSLVPAHQPAVYRDIGCEMALDPLSAQRSIPQAPKPMTDYGASSSLPPIPAKVASPTDSGHRGLAAGTGLHAPNASFEAARLNPANRVASAHCRSLSLVTPPAPARRFAR